MTKVRGPLDKLPMSLVSIPEVATSQEVTTIATTTPKPRNLKVHIYYKQVKGAVSLEFANKYQK